MAAFCADDENTATPSNKAETPRKLRMKDKFMLVIRPPGNRFVTRRRFEPHTHTVCRAPVQR
jgi:hypothetical protein